MVERTNEADPTYSLKHLEILEDRMKHHIVKFWSLPLAYVTVTFLAFTRTPDGWSVKNQSVLAYSLIVFGVITLLAMRGSYEGTKRAIEHIERIEKELKLVVTVRLFWLHYVPYVLIALLGILYAALQVPR